MLKNRVKFEVKDRRCVTKCPFGEIDVWGVKIVAGSTCGGCKHYGGQKESRQIICFNKHEK